MSLSPLEEIKEKIKKEREMSSVATEEPAQLEELPPVAGTTKPALVQVKSPSPEEPKITLKGVGAAGLRGLSVPLAQSVATGTLGFLVGGPSGARIGAGSGPLILGLTDLATEGANYLTGKDIPTTRGIVTKFLDDRGVEKPDTATERIFEAVTEGIVSGGSSLGLKSGAEMIKSGAKSGLLAKIFPEATKKIAPSVVPKVQKAAQFLGEKPLEQLAIGGAASLASSGAQEAGAGPVVSTLAELGAGAAIPLTRAGFRQVRPTEAMKGERALEKLRGVYETVIPEESERRKIVEQFRKSREASDQDVRLMLGDITGNDALLALQRAMETSSQKVAEIKTQNIAGVAKKLGTTLEKTGVEPESMVKFFENEYNTLKQIADDADESLKLSGIDVSEEFNAAKKAVDDAEAAYQKGVITAEEKYKQAKSALDDYFEIENQKVSDRKMGELSTQTSNVFENQKSNAMDYATSLYSQVPDVNPFVLPNTKQVIDGIIATEPKGKGGRQDIPAIIEDIYANFVDKSGNLIPKTLNDPVKLRQKLNDDINKARRSGSKQEERTLITVKKAIDSDLEKLETAYPQLKKANKFYKEINDIYESKLAEKVFKEGENLTAFLDKFGSSEEGLLNLKNAILNHPEIASTGVAQESKNAGLRNLDQWVVSKANEAMRKPVGDKKYTSASLKRWLNQGEGSVIFKVFEDELKDSKDTIEEYILKFEDLEKSAIEAKRNVDLAKAQEITEGSPVKVSYENAAESKKLVDQSLEDSRKQLIKEFNEKTNEALNPANRFLGGKDAREVIGEVISTPKTAVRDMQNLIEAASQDPSGKAIEGLRNAGKQWLNREFRITGKSTTTKGIQSPALLVENLQADLKKVQDYLAVGTPERNAIELLFGKNSKEMQGLDMARETIDAMNKQTTLTASNLLKQEVKPHDVMDALITVGAIQVGQVKGFVVWKLIETMRKLGKSSEADVTRIFENLLAKSLYDTETASVAFQPISKETWPATKRIARNLGIQVRASDFGLEEEKEEKQPEEKTKMGFGFASGKEFPRF